MTETQTQTPKWEVTVYGMGTVFAGTKKKRARRVFNQYVEASRRPRAKSNRKAHGQVVTLWLNGSPHECLGGWADELAAIRKQQRDSWMQRKAFLQAKQTRLDREAIEREWGQHLAALPANALGN